MHALRRSHEALSPGGIVLDLIPFEAWVSVENAAGQLGRLDARAFARDTRMTVAALTSTVREGLFALERTLLFDVLEHFESAEELFEEVAGWRGTIVPSRLERRIRVAQPPFVVRQQLAFRRLRAR